MSTLHLFGIWVEDSPWKNIVFVIFMETSIKSYIHNSNSVGTKNCNKRPKVFTFTHESNGVSKKMFVFPQSPICSRSTVYSSGLFSAGHNLDQKRGLQSKATL